MIKEAKDIKTVMMIGNGRMGTDIGMQCAIYGKNVRYFIGVEDPVEDVNVVRKRQADYLDSLIEKGFISERVKKEALERVTFDDNIERICKGVDLVVEAVLEILDVKRKTWARFAPYFEDYTILATNTATMLPSAFADASEAPDRFVGWHFATPAYILNFVDVMPHPGTDPEVCRVMGDFSEMVGMNVGVMEKELGNYVSNSMLFSFWDKAFELVTGGYATCEEIDKYWMIVRNAPIGPFGSMDKVGLPNVRNNYAARVDDCVVRERAIAYLDKMLKEGKEGIRNGKGFYTYPNPKFEEPDFVKRAEKLQ